MKRIFIVLIFNFLCYCGFSQSTPVNEQQEDNKIYVDVEVQASPAKGMMDFYQNFAKSFNAPRVEKGVTEIKVYLSFVVEKDGSFTEIKVLRNPGYGAGEEAVRVLKSMPNWKPAVQNGSSVRSQFTFPITIKINN
jgi:periplasmic protein TonB